MWVARDISDFLFLYKKKPIRVIETYDIDGDIFDRSFWNGEKIGELAEDLFPTLKWEDEPIEVELVIKAIGE